MTETDEDYVELPMKELDAIINGALSARGHDWMEFAFKVLTHVERYTVPQYGDRPDDQIEQWSVEDCLTAVKKRLARYGRNTRSGQQELDFMKMVHEIQIAADKYNVGNRCAAIKAMDRMAETHKEDVTIMGDPVEGREY